MPDPFSPGKERREARHYPTSYEVLSSHICKKYYISMEYTDSTRYEYRAMEAGIDQTPAAPPVRGSFGWKLSPGNPPIAAPCDFPQYGGENPLSSPHNLSDIDKPSRKVFLPAGMAFSQIFRIFARNGGPRHHPFFSPSNGAGVRREEVRRRGRKVVRGRW